MNVNLKAIIVYVKKVLKRIILNIKDQITMNRIMIHMMIQTMNQLNLKYFHVNIVKRNLKLKKEQLFMKMFIANKKIIHIIAILKNKKIKYLHVNIVKKNLKLKKEQHFMKMFIVRKNSI